MTYPPTRVVMAAAPIAGVAAFHMIGPGYIGAAAMVAGLLIGSVFARSYWELVYTIVWAIPALAAILLVATYFVRMKKLERELPSAEK